MNEFVSIVHDNWSTNSTRYQHQSKANEHPALKEKEIALVLSPGLRVMGRGRELGGLYWRQRS